MQPSIIEHTKKMDTSLVSVILCVHNRKQYLTEAIDSVLQQTYPHIELIVVDDGSTIDLRDIFDQYQGKIKVITHEHNRGLSAAINSGLKIARGEFINILADDDGFMPDKIEKQLTVFNSHPEVDVVYTDYKILRPDGNFIGHTANKQAALNRQRNSMNLYYTLLRGNFIDAISPLVKRTCYEKVGNYDERLHNLEDWDMWLRLVNAGFKFHYLDEPLIFIRRHPENKSKDPLRNMHQRFKVLYKVFSRNKSGSKEWQTVRKQAYATIFFDYAYAVYKHKKYADYIKYMNRALKLDRSRATAKAMRRLIKSYLMKMFRSTVPS